MPRTGWSKSRITSGLAPARELAAAEAKLTRQQKNTSPGHVPASLAMGCLPGALGYETLTVSCFAFGQGVRKGRADSGDRRAQAHQAAGGLGIQLDLLVPVRE